ncbi:MAG TPA: DUF5009 domain-containing protein [Armatimonadota bacterium]|jgi:predicted acyltransferase
MERSYALDALRGVAILAMVLSGIVPHGLPAWMYHAQEGPPTYISAPIVPGLTWVDLVFPLFLFAMGAAIPLALSRRLEKGTPMRSILGGIAWRGVMLAIFAVYNDHVGAYAFTSDASAGKTQWALALLGFSVLWPVWGRFPAKWSKTTVTAVRVVGWAGLAALMALLPLTGVQPAFRLGFRNWVGVEDIIILVLANVSVAGSLIWLCTRGQWWARLAPAGLFLALRIGSSWPGWAHSLWQFTPADWLYRMEFLKYLIIVLPGTVVGDVLLQGMRAPAQEPTWARARYAALATTAFAFVPLVLSALEARWVLRGTLASLALGALAWALVARPGSERERLLARLIQWGTYWLIIGLCFEPYEGGIRKDGTTISYFFVCMGLAHLALAGFTVIVDVWNWRRPLSLLIDNGQNPLLAYMACSNLVLPILALATVAERVDKLALPPWGGAAYAALVTLISALFVSVCTRRAWMVRA